VDEELLDCIRMYNKDFKEKYEKDAMALEIKDAINEPNRYMRLEKLKSLTRVEFYPNAISNEQLEVQLNNINNLN